MWMNDETEANLKNIVDKLNIKSKSEAIRFSLEFTSVVSDYIADGRKLFLKTQNNDFIPLHIHEIKKGSQK